LAQEFSVEMKEPVYELVPAIGLVKDGVKVLTWLTSDFDHKLPTLDHPMIKAWIEYDKKSIECHESKKLP